MNALRQDFLRRVEQAWGSSLLADCDAVARKRDEVVRAVKALSDRFFRDFEAATGQELQLNHRGGRWGVVYRRHLLMSVREMRAAFGEQAIAKLFGKTPTEQEFRRFMNLVTIQFQINEGQA